MASKFYVGRPCVCVVVVFCTQRRGLAEQIINNMKRLVGPNPHELFARIARKCEFSN